MIGKSIYLRDRPAFTGGSPQAVYEELWQQGRRGRLRMRAGFAAGGLLLGSQMVSVGFGLLLAVTVAGADALHHWWRYTAAGTWRRGLTGERRMTRILRLTLERRGHRVLYARSVPGHGEVQHLVIGPSGVWLVENRAWHPEREIEEHGGKLFIEGRSVRALAEGLHESARTVARLLSQRLDTEIATTAVIAVHGGRLRRGITAHGIHLRRATRVPGLIRRRRVPGYSREEVEAITRAATHVLPIGSRGLTLG
ncbi:MAG: nuclease-related domain-containing protein [Actinomadura sp.]